MNLMYIVLCFSIVTFVAAASSPSSNGWTTMLLDNGCKILNLTVEYESSKAPRSYHTIVDLTKKNSEFCIQPSIATPPPLVQEEHSTAEAQTKKHNESKVVALVVVGFVVGGLAFPLAKFIIHKIITKLQSGQYNVPPAAS